MGMDPMTKEERDVQRKLKVLRHAEKTGPAGTGRPFHLRYMSAGNNRKIWANKINARLAANNSPLVVKTTRLVPTWGMVVPATPFRPFVHGERTVGS